MFLLNLLLKNAFRHRLRTALTMFGLVVAIAAFGLLRTIVDAWYAGADASSSTRLIVRNAISLTFPVPQTYAQRIRGIEGVKGLSWSNWFGGVYVTERNFFPQFAVDVATYLPLYPEFIVSDKQRRDFIVDRQGVMVGRSLADKFGWKIGDSIPIRGTIYPGTWTFTLRAIYDGIDARTDEGQFLFHWQLLAETFKQRYPGRAFDVGVYVVSIKDPTEAATVSRRIDESFANSLAETLTETEQAFQLSFVAMVETILVAVQAVSYIIVLIIMIVLANTMAMTARERIAEYATLEALGFGPGFVARLIFGESLLIALLGGIGGLAVTLPLAGAFRQAAGTLFPVFVVSPLTQTLQIAAALVVGLVAAAWPAWRMSRLDIVAGLRHVA
jgi:putative ABC transport system permease protein